MITKPIFTGGTGRCGTSLVARILGAHPRVASFNEARLIFGSNWSLTGWERGEEPADVFDTILGIHWAEKLSKCVTDPFNMLGDPAAYFTKERLQSTWLHCTQHEPSRQGVVRRFAEAILGGWALTNGCSIFAEKQPGLVHERDRVFRLWKGAQVLFCIRDPQDVFDSMRQRYWGASSPEDFVKLWKRTVRDHRSQGGSVVCLERLVARPEEVIPQLFNIVDKCAGMPPVDPKHIGRAISLVREDQANIGRAGELNNIIEEGCRDTYEELKALAL